MQRSGCKVHAGGGCKQGAALVITHPPLPLMTRVLLTRLSTAYTDHNGRSDCPTKKKEKKKIVPACTL